MQNPFPDPRARARSAPGLRLKPGRGIERPSAANAPLPGSGCGPGGGVSPVLPQCVLAEALGTALLVGLGTSAAVVNEQTHRLEPGGVALSFGLVLMVLIRTLGPVSGAHLNPVVTLAFWLAGRFPSYRVLPYLGAQGVGALVGSSLVKLLAPPGSTLGATLPAHGAGQALLVETGLTCWLVVVVLRVTTGAIGRGPWAGLFISAAVVVAALVGGPLSGASMNPVRSLAPALLSGQLADGWVYVVGPVVGALLAVAADRFVLRPSAIAQCKTLVRVQRPPGKSRKPRP